MGGKSESKVETNIVNDAVTNVMMSSSQQCAATNSTSQTIKLGKIKAGKNCIARITGVSNDATVKQDFSCMQNNSQNADLMQKISNAIDAKTEAAVKGLAVGSASATTLTNAKNTIRNNINISNLSSCMANNLAKQKIETEGMEVGDCCDPGPYCTTADRTISQDNISNKLVSAQVAKCLQGNEQVARAATEIDNVVKASASSKNEGLTLPDLSSLASSGLTGTSVLIPIIVSIVLSVLLSLFMMMMK
jgi:hypothetical protein